MQAQEYDHDEDVGKRLSYQLAGEFRHEYPTTFSTTPSITSSSFRVNKEHTQKLVAMQAANRLQKALRTGSGLSFGAWQMLPGSNQSRTIARCGFDWVCVDTEHGNIDGNETQSLA